jgi:hypothetical protein
MFKIYKGEELNEDDFILLATYSIETIQWIATKVLVTKQNDCRVIKFNADGSQTSHKKKKKRKTNP